MSEQLHEVKVPDLGGDSDVDVIEVLVKVGDVVAAEDALLTLESDKATMDVPSPMAGIVEKLSVQVGDKVSEGSVIMHLRAEAAELSTDKVAASTVATQAQRQALVVPDLGGDSDVDVIEVLVKVGDTVAEEDALVTLESDKATMDVPSAFAGKILEFNLTVGDKVSEGMILGYIEAQASASIVEAPQTSAPQKTEPTPKTDAAPAPVSTTTSAGSAYASPGVRRLARELGVDVSQVPGRGPKARILKKDVYAFVKQRMSVPASAASALPAAPDVDFSLFGPIEEKALSKINKLTGKHLLRNWLLAPHVTQFDEGDISAMEAFRQQNKAQAQKQGFKLTPLVFIMKAVVSTLQAYPRFNTSLSADGTSLVYKQYFHIGVAVDTPDGLVVPVVRDVDQKSLFDLAKELGEISVRARDGKLTPKQMRGGCFTISSLGGIGGTAFTPIINLPEVAILGVSKSQMKPVYDGKQFVPRLMLPISLSYDHRVIDGANGARFSKHLLSALNDEQQWIL